MQSLYSKLKAFSPGTPQSIKRQNNVPKGHDGIFIFQVMSIIYSPYILFLLPDTTKRLRSGFDNIQMDVQGMRDDLLDLFDRLDAIDRGTKDRLKGKFPSMETGRRSYMGSRQFLSSSTDLRGSSYALSSYDRR